MPDSAKGKLISFPSSCVVNWEHGSFLSIDGNTGVFVIEWVGSSSCALFFHDVSCVIVHVHRARECNGEICVYVRVGVKQQDRIEYRNTSGKSNRCSRVWIALLTLHTTVSKFLCFWYRLLKCVTPGGSKIKKKKYIYINPLNPELNPICYLLALLGAHHFLHVSRIRVKSLTLGRLMSYIYIWSTHSWCF